MSQQHPAHTLDTREVRFPDLTVYRVCAGTEYRHRSMPYSVLSCHIPRMVEYRLLEAVTVLTNPGMGTMS